MAQVRRNFQPRGVTSPGIVTMPRNVARAAKPLSRFAMDRAAVAAQRLDARARARLLSQVAQVRATVYGAAPRALPLILGQLGVATQAALLLSTVANAAQQGSVGAPRAVLNLATGRLEGPGRAIVDSDLLPPPPGYVDFANLNDRFSVSAYSPHLAVFQQPQFVFGRWRFNYTGHFTAAQVRPRFVPRPEHQPFPARRARPSPRARPGIGLYNRTALQPLPMQRTVNIPRMSGPPPRGRDGKTRPARWLAIMLTRGNAASEWADFIEVVHRAFGMDGTGTPTEQLWDILWMLEYSDRPNSGFSGSDFMMGLAMEMLEDLLYGLPGQAAAKGNKALGVSVGVERALSLG